MKDQCLLPALLLLSTLSCQGAEHSPETSEGPATSKYLTLADATADWLCSTAITEPEGLSWLAFAEAEGGGDMSFYHGTPGIVAFLLEHHAQGGDERSLAAARGGLDWLLAQAQTGEDGLAWGPAGYPSPGLYTGTAGVGAVLLAAGAQLSDERYTAGARGAADWLVDVDQDGAWNNSYDVVSGSAGTGFFLLRAAERFESPAFLARAARAGDHLIAVAEAEGTGLKWPAGLGGTRYYPNFSHGTSGVATFLALLASATDEERYLDAARSGATWLSEQRRNTNPGSAWYHHAPGAEELYYVSWCHGPGGTARLYRALFEATGEGRWLEEEARCARWILSSGFLDRSAEEAWDGFWNPSACCGSAGVGDFLADTYRLSGEEAQHAFARRLVDDIEARATPGDPGLKWISAEHRTRPEEVLAQTGWAQGAAGIGLFLLKMHALETGASMAWNPPDSPYR